MQEGEKDSCSFSNVMRSCSFYIKEVIPCCLFQSSMVKSLQHLKVYLLISPCLTEIDSKLYITSLPEFYAYFWLPRSGLVVVNFLVLQVLYRGIIEKRLCKENSLVVARVASVEWSSCGE